MNFTYLEKLHDLIAQNSPWHEPLFFEGISHQHHGRKNCSVFLDPEPRWWKWFTKKKNRLRERKQRKQKKNRTILCYLKPRSLVRTKKKTCDTGFLSIDCSHGIKRYRPIPAEFCEGKAIGKQQRWPHQPKKTQQLHICDTFRLPLPEIRTKNTSFS